MPGSPANFRWPGRRAGRKTGAAGALIAMLGSLPSVCCEESEMPENARVDVAICAAGDLGTERDALTGLHGSTVAGVEGAHSGWVGSSAAALCQLTSGRRTASLAHASALGDHGGHIDSSAT